MPPRIRIRTPPRHTPQCITTPSRTRPFHTRLTSASSPAIESHWLSQNARHAKGGALLAAKMSPRAQLVAAEEGLLGSWLEAGTKKASHVAGQSSSITAAPAAAEVRAVGAETLQPGAVAKLGHQGVGGPLKPRRWDAKAGATERDDTPGLIAFSALLLLPLAFQMGRYFEGRDHQGWPADSVFARVLKPEMPTRETKEAKMDHGNSREWKWSRLFWAGEG